MQNKKTKAIVRVNQTYAIDKPAQMIQAAKIIKDHIVKNNLSVNIVGKNYVLVEGWQFAGSLMNLFPKVVKVENLGDNKWMAQVDLINRKTGESVSTGFAVCSKAEQKKASFDEYAILSMAQTRAIGKAFRNTIGWIIKLSGFEATPAEEMKGKPGEAPVASKPGQSLPASEIDKKRIVDLTKELGAKTAQATAKMVENMAKRKVDWTKMTKNEAATIYATLLQKKINKK
jgi:hypothetical protein